MNQYKGQTERYQLRKSKKRSLIILSLVLITVIGIGGTFAYLADSTEPLINTFFPAKVEVEVEEKFENNKKTEILVKNTGNTDAYIRVKLVSYRVNDEGKRIGGKAPVTIKITDNWKEHNGFYYYLLPVETGEETDNLLTDTEPITLEDYSSDTDDPDGGKQVIEVMAEGIQSTPMDAVKEAWGQDVFNLLGGGE